MVYVVLRLAQVKYALYIIAYGNKQARILRMAIKVIWERLDNFPVLHVREPLHLLRTTYFKSWTREIKALNITEFHFSVTNINIEVEAQTTGLESQNKTIS